MRLQERDTDILKEVFRFSCLTSYQMVNLFDLNIKICQRRLRILVKSDYLRRMFIPTTNQGRSPYLYYPGKKSEDMFGLPASKPRINNQLSHQIKNTDLMIYIKKSFEHSDIQCHLLPEHIIRITQQKLIPDGAFKLTRNDNSALFLFENCEGTEIINSPSFHEDIENKIIKYCEVFQNNEVDLYDKFFDQQFTRFRLVFITNTAKRLESISKTIKKHDSFGFIYITTKSSFLKNDIFSPIWSIPAKNEISVSLIKVK